MNPPRSPMSKGNIVGKLVYIFAEDRINATVGVPVLLVEANGGIPYVMDEGGYFSIYDPMEDIASFTVREPDVRFGKVNP